VALKFFIYLFISVPLRYDFGVHHICNQIIYTKGSFHGGEGDQSLKLHHLYYYYLFTSTANGFLPGGSGLQ
jgi:hypothetical protein